MLLLYWIASVVQLEIKILPNRYLCMFSLKNTPQTIDFSIFLLTFKHFIINKHYAMNTQFEGIFDKMNRTACLGYNTKMESVPDAVYPFFNVFTGKRIQVVTKRLVQKRRV